MKPCTIIHLIDFYGHAAMDTADSISLRFGTLKDIISMHEVDKSRVCVIADTPNAKSEDYVLYNTLRERFLEMVRVAELYDWKWINCRTPVTRDRFFELAETEGGLVDVSPQRTHIIYGGVNTSGCVFERRDTSLLEIARLGYTTTLFLPLCSDPGVGGRDVIEKSVKSYSRIYNTLQECGLITQVRIKHRYADLELPEKA